MMYLRHPNGRGKLFDDAEANLATRISRDSSASGQSKLRDCWLAEGSHAKDHCQIYGGQYCSTEIRGKTICAGSPNVTGSLLDCWEVSGNVHIVGASLLGSTEVCDNAWIQDATLRDAIVYGDVRIAGKKEFTGRIHEGLWLWPPKHIKLPWCDLSECIDGKVILDCRCRHYDYWMRHGAKLARRWGWEKDMIEMTLDTIRKEFGEWIPSRPAPNVDALTVQPTS